MYGNGKAEKVVGEIVKKCDRKKLFIVDKILPDNAKKGLYEESCRRSLELVGVDYFDLYLLHWRSNVDLKNMIEEMENLVKMGLIRHWGVSNFDVDEMEELFSYPNGDKCFANQILYNVLERGIEFDLISWCKNHHVLLMAYSPLCNNKKDREKVSNDKRFIELAKSHDQSAESLMLSFVIRNNDFITIFKTSDKNHLDNNMQNVFLEMDDNVRKEIDALYPAPKQKIPLQKI